MKDERNHLGHKATCRNGSTLAPSKKHVAPIKDTEKSRIAQFKAAPTTFSCLEKTQKMEMQAVLKGLYHREVHDQEAFVHS